MRLLTVPRPARLFFVRWWLGQADENSDAVNGRLHFRDLVAASALVAGEVLLWIALPAAALLHLCH